MISKILINVVDIKYIDDYRKVGVSAFLFALEGYSVGYNTYSLEEINKMDVSNKYIIINRLLDCNDVDNLREVLKDVKDVKGIVYEDIAVYQLIKELKIDVEMIFFQNHLGTNSRSVNFWLDRVDSIFLSNEITSDEIKNILKSVKREACVHLYGHNQVMYSRRLLLSNWSQEFNIPFVDKNIIEDKATHVRFRAMENNYGTVMYSDNIFNGRELLGLDNIKYYYVNPMLIDHDLVMDFLNNLEGHTDESEDNGFLNRETIYKLKERNR